MSSKSRHEIRSNTKSVVLGTLAGCLMWMLARTLRVRFHDEAGISDPDANCPPLIYVMWHNRIFVVPPIWSRQCRRHRKCVVLTSASRDGEMVARAMALFGLDAVRGSSSRRGAAALIGLRRALRDGHDACITPDGPKGPRYRLQPGVVKLAESSGFSLMPIHVRCASAWRLKSWDRFVIPKPFSRVEVTFAAPVRVEPGLSGKQLEAECQKLEAMLVNEVDDA